MTVTLATAHGAPCPTLVLDGRTLPGEENGLLAELTRMRTELSSRGAGHVLKNAIIRPSRHPLFDLDYRFVQSLPHGTDRFDLRGSCGHSILAAVEAAARNGMIQPLVPGCRVRVNVLNNGDNVVCETEATADGGSRFTAHFLCSPPRPLTDLLITGEPVTPVPFDGRTVPVSLVSMGNPYVFVSAAELGVTSRQELFAADSELFDALQRLRLAVCGMHGWDSSGAFPKIAALLPGAAGTLAVRAVSVPSWHPTVALTGAICLGSATGIEGTVPHLLAAEAGHRTGLLSLQTAGGPVRVAAATSGESGTRELAWVSVAGKQVDFRGRLPVQHRVPASASTAMSAASAAASTAVTTAVSTDRSEETPWLPLTV